VICPIELAISQAKIPGRHMGVKKTYEMTLFGGIDIY
jgi:hypothetical protein